MQGRAKNVTHCDAAKVKFVSYVVVGQSFESQTNSPSYNIV